MKASPPIYLDYAAATPVDSTVLAAMLPYFSEKFYNPSASYLSALQVSGELNAARAKVAQLIGGQPGEIIFTAGGTEANNLAVRGVMSQFEGANMVVSSIEHPSVNEPSRLYPTKQVAVDAKGLLDLAGLAAAIDDQTVLVSIIYANNEIGTIQPFRETADQLQRIRRDRQTRGIDLPLYVHTDACQAAAYLDIHAHRLGVDLMTLNGGKIYGPKQSGILYVRAGVQLAPQIYGGGQERGLRSGTENVAQAIGFAEALSLVQARRHDEVQRLRALQKLFITLVGAALPAAHSNGSPHSRLPNNVHLTIPGTDNERLMMQLDEAGVQCAVGSACSASSDTPSSVLRAIGLSDVEARSSLRFTMGIGTTEAHIRQTVELLAGFCR